MTEVTYQVNHELTVLLVQIKRCFYLSAERKQNFPDSKLSLPCMHMVSSSILGTLIYFPVLQNTLKILTPVFSKCLCPDSTRVNPQLSMWSVQV